jgi:hypothetical protein
LYPVFVARCGLIFKEDYSVAGIVAQELRRLGLQEQDLVTRRKNDPTKLELAGRLRQQTTLPLKAIAARLHLGTSKTAASRLHSSIAKRFDGRGCLTADPRVASQ